MTRLSLGLRYKKLEELLYSSDITQETVKEVKENKK